MCTRHTKARYYFLEDKNKLLNRQVINLRTLFVNIRAYFSLFNLFHGMNNHNNIYPLCTFASIPIPPSPPNYSSTSFFFFYGHKAN